MNLRLAPAFGAAALLFAAPGFAAGPGGGYDDVTYPDVQATFSNAVDPTPIVTPDVTYPGPHASVSKQLPAPASIGALAMHDDTVYPTAAPARAEQPSQQLANQRAPAGNAAANVRHRPRS